MATRKTDREIQRPPREYSAPALEKGMEILELLNVETAGLTVNQITKKSGRNRSEIFRVMRVLCKLGYLEYQERDHIYRLSFKMFEQSHRYARVQRLTSIAMPIMSKLAQQSNQSYHLVVYSAGGGVILAQQESYSNSLRISYPIGGTGPLINNCAGHVLLAFSGENQRAKMLEETVQRWNLEAVDTYKVYKTLHRVREAGYEKMESPALEGIIDIGFPVLNHTGSIAAVLMLSQIKFKEAYRHLSGPEPVWPMKRAAAEISRQLGFPEKTDSTAAL